MKHYNFDEIIDRKGTSCVKYDGLKNAYQGKENLIPLWVADMDFATPDFIVEALKKRCEHPVFGYTFDDDEYYESIQTWLDYKYHWKTEREWISYIPGIVKGIGLAVQCFTQPGDKVIIQPPVYHPFRLVPTRMGREVVYNPLKLEDGVYKMDFEQLESLIDKDCKMLILSNPHNPGGVVWEKEALVKLAQICSAHGILVISDEIHAEMTYPQFRHHPFATVSEEAAACSVTFMAPSKTFNIAGIVSSYALVPDSRIREKFYSFLEAGELNAGTIFAFTATKAAYTYGAEWLQQMRSYVIENVNFVDEYLKKNIPQIKVYRPQASFLVWLDCRELKLTQSELVQLFEDKAGLALNDGTMFGKEGEGFMRLNIGCPRSILNQALESLKKAIG
ncbi:PatB family C-S lyase [Parabacteroides sp. AGMB00274]|uniref:cysteine-S-conjugate beta-lyase n=1 Tax=Parabacteroides faecalis TaxID=2924040 RepID=A0ABT0BYI6_9BACT|nr:PatB family C-S lyase [Parabacteroides faecalis]MCI7286048.1 PatB family C-S lyase [Parabacteroides sp.]MCJ2379827.1 PatB family C-S lyase [Parabacteroides faecalis]MDY6253839.1 PatB family C-S lyase [Bacteroidales bacterium]